MTLNPGCKAESPREHLKIPTLDPFPEILFQLVWEGQIRHHTDFFKAPYVTNIQNKSLTTATNKLGT